MTIPNGTIKLQSQLARQVDTTSQVLIVRTCWVIYLWTCIYFGSHMLLR